jgi:hypothetical protein
MRAVSTSGKCAEGKLVISVETFDNPDRLNTSGAVWWDIWWDNGE